MGDDRPYASARRDCVELPVHWTPRRRAVLRAPTDPARHAARAGAPSSTLAAAERRHDHFTLHPEILGRPHRVRRAAPRARARGGSRHPGADARARSLLDAGDQVRDRLAQPAGEPDDRAQLRVARSRARAARSRPGPSWCASDNASCVKPASSRRRRRFCANWSVGSTGAHAVASAGRAPGPEPQVAANRAGSGASRDTRAGRGRRRRASPAAAGRACARWSSRPGGARRSPARSGLERSASAPPARAG